jgi:hypothetical protein
MGAFIPSPNDQEIIAKLNFLFSGATLAQIKAFTDKNGKPLFPAKNLSRVARRIGAYPNTTSDPHGRNPRARWFVFLENLPGSTKQSINTLLAEATNAATGYDGVVFDLTHQKVGGKPPYVAIGSTGSPGEVLNFPDGKTILFITLVCDDPIANDPPASAGGSHDRPHIGHDPGGTLGNEKDFWPSGSPWQKDDTDY